MSSANINKQIRAFFVENWGAEFAQISDTDPLFSSDKLSSLDFIRLLLFLEEAFGAKIEVEKTDSQTLDSIRDIVAFVNKRQD